MKHTPGPWKLDPCSNGGLILRRGEAIRGDRHPQSHLQIVPVEDAYLIAAAPELLAALKEAKEIIHLMHGDLAWGIYDQHSPEMKRINGAISKAEGRT